MLTSLGHRQYAQSYDEYPELSDIIENEIDGSSSYSGNSSPVPSTHVYSRDSPPYQPIGCNDILSDSSDCGSLPRSYTEREAILVFNRAWHQVKEPRISVSPLLFDYNPDITPSMRCRLISWLVEVSMHFRLHRETFFLAVYFIDRYLSLRSGVSRRSLQLLGISALFVAAKLEEIYPPTLREFSEVCDGSCPALMIHETEVNLLMTLRWHLNVATPVYWLSLYLTLLVPYFSECHLGNLYERSMELLIVALHTSIAVKFSYGILAASVLAIYLPRPVGEELNWSTGFHPSQLSPCIEALRALEKRVPASIEFPLPSYKCPAEEFDRIVHRNSLVLQTILEHMKLSPL